MGWEELFKGTESSSRIKFLIKQLYEGKPEIEWSRAKLITESYKSTEEKPTIIRRAIALHHILENMPIVIRENELVVGNFTNKPRSAQVFLEYSNKWIKDEFELFGKRKGDIFTITDETKEILRGCFEYWDGKTVNELAKSYMMEETLEAMDANVFTVNNYFYNGVGHISVDYKKVLEKGFNGIILEAEKELKSLDKTSPDYSKAEKFLEAVIISSEAIIIFANRFSKRAEELANIEKNVIRKRELLQIADVCSKVPARGATTFYEAIQSFWFVHAVLQIESNGHSISPMRFDQYMYPYYKKDIEKGNINNEFAQELIDCVFIKLNEINKVRDEASTRAFGGYPLFQNLIVGGQTEDGQDATNELSFMALEATNHTRLPQPSISIRVWEKSPEILMMKAAQISRLGTGMPAYYNDQVVIPALVKRGVDLKDARDYGIIGCVEPQKGGKTEGWHDSGFVNLVKILESTLYNGVLGNKQIGPVTGELEDFKNIEDLMEAYKIHMNYYIKLLVNAENSVDIAHSQRAPLPFESSLVDDCIARHKSVQEGGAHYNFTGPQGVGVANVGDSFAAIDTLVFKEKKLTMEDVKAAIKSNFGQGNFNDDISSSAMSNSTLDYSSSCSSNYNDSSAYSSGLGSNYSLVGGLNDEQLLINLIAEEVKKQLERENIIGVAKNNVDDDISRKDIDNVMSTRNVANTSYIKDVDNAISRKDGEYIRQLLLNKAPKYGNDDDYVDFFAREAALIYCREVEKYKNPRNGVFQPGLYPASINVAMGQVVGATPDGRLAGKPLADGVSPSAGVDKKGPTAVLRSVAKLDHEIASNGTLLNQKFHPSVLQGEKGLRNLVNLVNGYFNEKGMHVQFNVISREMLIKAKEHPEEYKHLVVRVAGYSAQFVSLDPAVQDDIINRTEQMSDGV